MSELNFSLQFLNNTKQKSDENKEKYQLGDYKLIQYEILQNNIIRIIPQTVRRIANEILGVKGLKGDSTGTTGWYWTDDKEKIWKIGIHCNFLLLSYSILYCNIIITPYLLNVRTLFFSAGMHADLQSCKFLVFSKMAIYLLRGMVNKL